MLNFMKLMMVTKVSVATHGSTYIHLHYMAYIHLHTLMDNWIGYFIKGRGIGRTIQTGMAVGAQMRWMMMMLLLMRLLETTVLTRKKSIFIMMIYDDDTDENVNKILQEGCEEEGGCSSDSYGVGISKVL